MLEVLEPDEKTIIHILSVNSLESTKDKVREGEHIIEELGEWQGTVFETGFQLVKTPGRRVPRIADLIDDNPARRDRVAAALRDRAQKNNRDHVDIIVALGMAKEGVRLDLVRSRAHGRLPVEPDRDRADHRARHARRARR